MFTDSTQVPGSRLLSSLALALLLGSFPAAAIGPTESGTPSTPGVPDGGYTGVWEGLGLAPPMPDDNPPAGAKARAPNLTFSYYTVSGATLRGRSTSAGYSYAGLGCTYTLDADRILNTELPIPDGATIKYLRVYYRDTNASAHVTGLITRYEPGQAFDDLVSVSSTAAFAGGYGFTVSAEINEVVNNATYAYTLLGVPSLSSNTVQICGLRVAYYAP